MGARTKAGWLVFVCLVCLPMLAANLRLYLKDGSYHIAREYQVQADRVRFYSVERSDWEEVPLDLVDLKRTEAEVKSRQAVIEEEAKILTTEEQADRQQQQEVARVPEEPGVYLVEGKEVKPIPQAVAKAVTDKGRRILKMITPVPLVASKATVEMEGERSANVVTNPQQEFYFRMALPERFAIFKVRVKKGARVVQTWQIIPVSDEVAEEQEIVPVLHRQLDSNLYKIWPTQPLKPGEYAVVEYTTGQQNIQVWDFAYGPASEPQRK